MSGGSDQAHAALVATEHWFTVQGVPHFGEGAPVTEALPAKVTWLRRLAEPIAIAMSVAVWVLRRTRGEFGELGKLAGRGLPLLALFGVVLFFSGDFWHIAVALSAWWLWTVSGLFMVLNFVFLLSRLPEEYNRLPTEYSIEDVREACAGTPVESWVADGSGVAVAGDARIGWPQRRNMLVYLLLCQQIQVFLLSWIVFFFFVAFGAVSVRPAVVEGWFGRSPSLPAHVLGVPVPGVSSELLHSALLLSAVSAFYFTVAAITDEGYRREFFDRTLAELGRAVRVRCGYLSVRAATAEAEPAAVSQEPDPEMSSSPVL
jgi:hypothetical protein